MSNISQDRQQIDVRINNYSTTEASKKSRSLINWVYISVSNLSNSYIEIIPEKSFFQDNHGVHSLKIAPIRILAHQTINLPIESTDYYQFGYSFSRYGGTGGTYMGSLNARYLILNLAYKTGNSECIGMFEIQRLIK